MPKEGSKGPGLTDMAALMGEAVEAIAAAQAAGFAMLQAEAEALARALPGAEGDADAASAQDARAREARQEADREAGFDNMPV